MNIALLVIQILTFLALIIYVVATWRMAAVNSEAAKVSAAALEEMRATREAESRPYVSVFAEPNRVENDAIDLVVQNFGRTAAHRISLSFQPELQASLPRLKELCAFLSQGITFLAPGARLSTALGSGTNYVKAGLPLLYEVTLEYSDDSGHHLYRQEQRLDVTQGRGAATVLDMDKKRIVEAAVESSHALTSISRKLDRLADHHPQ